MTQPTRAKAIAWANVPEDVPLAQVRRRRIAGEHAMISRFELGAGCEVPTHSHANEQFACVLSGCVRFVVGESEAEEAHVLHGGEVLHLPAWVPHAAFGIEDAVVLDVFAPPSETSGVDDARQAQS